VTGCPIDAELPDGPGLSAAETTFRWLARPFELLDECAAAHGDTFSLHFTRFGTHVVVAHPDDVRDVFTADPHVLHAGRGNALLEPILGRHSLLLVDEERHLAQRALLQPAFRHERVQGYTRMVADAARRWTAAWNGGATVSVQRTALEISKEIILRAVFGLSDPDVEGFSRLIHDLMQLVGTNATFDADTDGRLLERFRVARAALDEAMQEHIARRRRERTSGDDLLSLLVEGGADDEEIRDQLFTMVLAGHETTASSITWAILCLHAAPAALAPVLRELDETGANLPDDRLAGLSWLQAACLETLRVRPVIPVVSREVRRPFRLRDRTLAPGLFVTPCAYLAHRRAEAFADPDAFRPERFLGRRYSPHAYFPFGGGVRRCIGMGFALLEMQTVLGVLLRSFRFAPAARNGVRPVRRNVTIVASGGARMHVERRTS